VGEGDEEDQPEDERAAAGDPDLEGSSGDEEERPRAASKHRKRSKMRGAEAEVAAAAPAPARRPRLRKPFVPLRWLQRLGEALTQARGAGALLLVEGRLLAALLAALQGHVELGLDRVVADDEEVRESSILRRRRAPRSRRGWARGCAACLIGLEVLCVNAGVEKAWTLSTGACSDVDTLLFATRAPPQPGSAAYDAVAASLEASVCCLQVRGLVDLIGRVIDWLVG